MVLMISKGFVHIFDERTNFFHFESFPNRNVTGFSTKHYRVTSDTFL